MSCKGPSWPQEGGGGAAGSMLTTVVLVGLYLHISTSALSPIDSNYDASQQRNQSLKNDSDL